jgi:hypothetical protein
MSPAYSPTSPQYSPGGGDDDDAEDDAKK